MQVIDALGFLSRTRLQWLPSFQLVHQARKQHQHQFNRGDAAAVTPRLRMRDLLCSEYVLCDWYIFKDIPFKLRLKFSPMGFPSCTPQPTYCVLLEITVVVL